MFTLIIPVVLLKNQIYAFKNWSDLEVKIGQDYVGPDSHLAMDKWIKETW